MVRTFKLTYLTSLPQGVLEVSNLSENGKNKNRIAR